VRIGAAPQTPRGVMNALSRQQTGADPAASTSSSAAMGGGCSVEFSIGRRGAPRRTMIPRACSSQSRGSQGEGSDSAQKQNRMDGVRYEWKWHERRGPRYSWDKGSLATNGQNRAHTIHSGAPEVWDSRDGDDVQHSASPISAGGEEQVTQDRDAQDGYESPEEEFRRYATRVPKKDCSGINLIKHADEYCRLLPEVYVVLFGVGESATEGIYSLRSHSEDTGLYVETIVCFESNEDAFRFAGLLEATMPHGPSIHTIRPNDLVKFCQDSGYACRLEPTGSLMMPPEFNVGITDWERSVRLREGRYTVLEKDPEVDMQALNGSFDETSSLEAGGLEAPEPQARVHLEVTDSLAVKIDEVRAMLERLLPDD